MACARASSTACASHCFWTLRCAYRGAALRAFHAMHVAALPSVALFPLRRLPRLDALLGLA
eukprot:1220884-Lingulodinium_polyedra.AAC.1